MNVQAVHVVVGGEDHLGIASISNLVEYEHWPCLARSAAKEYLRIVRQTKRYLLLLGLLAVTVVCLLAF